MAFGRSCGRCIACRGSSGAEFVPHLNTERIARVFRKGTDPAIDSYSGHRKKTGLAEYLNKSGVKEIFVAGLATDYCVKFTALDGQALGFKTHLIEDACRGVELKKGDVAQCRRGNEVSGRDGIPRHGSADFA
jgi:nicotinamidase/pyrazinamidase